VVDFRDGYAFSSRDFVEYGPNAIQVIRITDINNNKNTNKVYVQKSLIQKQNLRKYIITKGDLRGGPIFSTS
jgi:transcription termination factor Rho